MPRFFVCKDRISDGVVTLVGDDAHHLSRSLRMAAGERITVCDMQKFEYECELLEFLPDRVRAKVLSVAKADTEPPYEAHVYQALPKGDKLDTIIQKSVFHKSTSFHFILREKYCGDHQTLHLFTV